MVIFRLDEVLITASADKSFKGLAAFPI